MNFRRGALWMIFWGRGGFVGEQDVNLGGSGAIVDTHFAQLFEQGSEIAAPVESVSIEHNDCHRYPDAFPLGSRR